MEKYKINFLQSALDDLDEIVLYISQDSRKSAIVFRDKIIETTKRLETFPNIGRLVPDKKMMGSGFRMVIVDNYLLFYKIYSNDIDILRILHGNRNYPLLWQSIKKE